MLKHIMHLMVLSAALTAAHGASAVGADHASIFPYVADDVSTVAVIDLQKLNFPAVVEELAGYQLIPAEHLADARNEAAGIQGVYAELTKRGARRAYVLVRASDVFQGGPVWAIEVGNENEAAAVIEWLKPWLAKASDLGEVAAYLPKELVADGTMVLAASSSERLQQMKLQRRTKPREDVVAAFAALGDVDAAVVALGDADSRRIVREMFPQLPPPFAEIDGKFLADGLKWIGVTLKLPPGPIVSLTVEATGKETAARLQQLFDGSLTVAKAALLADMVKGPPDHKERAIALLPMLPSLQLQNVDSRLTFTFGDDEEEKTFLSTMLPIFSQKAQLKASLVQRMYQFKQIGLAMHNYASAAGHGAFPAHAIYDAKGRPLLSWRVQLLPYLDPANAELYKEFHLDEPWDSEHNRALVDKIPQLYADPDFAVLKAAGKGKTTFVTPTGKSLIFGGPQGVKFSDIKDGGSNAILVIEVVPEKAVVWTKPDDWEVNLDDPLAGVKRSDRSTFTAAFADGHVTSIENNVDVKKLRAMLTPSGGEPAAP